MRVVVVSDLHGDLDAARRAVDRFGPDLILSCGDWGDPEEFDEARFAALLAVAPVYTTFGNHDPMARLPRLRNADDSPVLLPQGERRQVLGLSLAAVGGIWAKSHKKPHYVTDDDVAEAAGRIARSGPVEVFLTHGCPVGLADLTPVGRHGGQPLFPRREQDHRTTLHLCGHLHVPQERTLKDGRRIINVGATPEGSVVVESDPGRGVLEARLEKWNTA